MDRTREIADEQVKLWNGPAGRAWVEGRDLLDRILQPFEDLLVAAVSAASAHHVLDVGCGTGSTTIAIARLLGEKGQAMGVDVSEPMVATARARAAQMRVNASFVCADAQTFPFERTSVDMIISRFGVMFFSDPVTAFVNLRSAATRHAELRFLSWRSAAENPFMTTAERAAAPLLPDLPPRRADGPGQFALADPQRIHGILENGGWSEISVEPLDVECSLPERELTRYVTKLGPVGLMLQDADEDLRMRVTNAVRTGFDPYVKGDEVRFTAACWMTRARPNASVFAGIV